jgi:hypothetical protein
VNFILTESVGNTEGLFSSLSLPLVKGKTLAEPSGCREANVAEREESDTYSTEFQLQLLDMEARLER